MNVQIHARNFEITQEIRDIIQERFTAKIELLLPHFSSELKTANLILERDKYGTYLSKFDIALPGKSGQIFSEHKHIDLIGCITGLREQVEKQIQKYKSELVNYTL